MRIIVERSGDQTASRSPLPAALVCRRTRACLVVTENSRSWRGSIRTSNRATTTTAPRVRTRARPKLCLLTHRSRVLAPAATPPRRAAASAAAAAAATSPTTPAGTCASASTTPPVGCLYAILEHCVILTVEDVEGRQVDVGNFFLPEEEFVMRCGILHRHIHCRCSSRCGCSAGHRQRYSGDSQRGCGSLSSVSF